MRAFTVLSFLILALTASAADLESRALTHYVPQDLLENIVRKEGWTEITLKPYDGVKKNDIARIWTGGVIDHGNGNQPGVNVTGPDGAKVSPAEAAKMALSPRPDLACPPVQDRGRRLAQTDSGEAARDSAGQGRGQALGSVQRPARPLCRQSPWQRPSL